MPIPATLTLAMASGPETPTTSNQKDIAKALGLTQSTVSKALKNAAEIGVSTRKLVQETAEKMGYQPNPMATGLAHFKHTSKMKPVQAALAWLNAWPKPQQLRSNRAFDLYWQGASQAALGLGYRLDEFILNAQMRPHRLVQILLSRGIHGLIIPPVPGDSHVNWSDFAWEHFSAVRFSRVVEGLPRFHLVTAAQSANAALAVREILARGYRRIGYVGCDRTGWTFLGGYLQEQITALSKAARLPPFLYDQTVNDAAFATKEVATRMTGQFISWLNKWKPDAILTESTFLAPLLKNAKLRVPADVAVATLSVGDLPFDAGIYQNPEEIGRVSALVIVSVLENNERGVPPIPRDILVHGTWVDGTSLPPRW